MVLPYSERPAGHPVDYAGTQAQVSGVAPRPGEHTDEGFRSLASVRTASLTCAQPVLFADPGRSQLDSIRKTRWKTY